VELGEAKWRAVCAQGGLHGVSLSNLLLPNSIPYSSPILAVCGDMSMDAALVKTFLPRAVQGAPKVGEGEEGRRQRRR
jgi:hypothetical protein